MSTEESRENERLSALRGLLVLDSSEETAYDDITKMAAAVFGTPVALVSLIDEERQWFKSRVGTDVEETPREYSFCDHAIRNPTQVMVVPDATKDPRFMGNPLVVGDPKIRFYAGAPLVTADGHAVGTLCVIDVVPRDVVPDLLSQLNFMAIQVSTMLQKRAEAQREKQPRAPS